MTSRQRNAVEVGKIILVFAFLAFVAAPGIAAFLMFPVHSEDGP